MKNFLTVTFAAIFVFLLNVNSNAQCTLVTSPDRTISCGDTVHMHAWSPDWQASTTFGSGGTTLVFHAGGDTVLAATGSQLFRSIDAGQTFSPAAFWPNGKYLKMIKLDNNKIIAVGDDNGATPKGNIIESNDFGYTWHFVKDFNSTRFFDVFFPSQNVGYAVGVHASNNRLAKTLDGGNTWTMTSFNPASINLTSVWFLNDTIGFCGGTYANGKIFKTIDGGNTWTETTHCADGNLLSNIRAIQFIFGTHGFALADDKLYQTLDSGATWQAMSSVSGSFFKIMHIHDNFLGYIAGINTLLKTVDGGATWTEVAPNTSTSYNAIHVVNPQMVYVAATSNHVYRETVNTYTWTPATGLNNPNSPNPIATPTASVTYTVSLQNNLGCSASADIQIDIPPFSVKAYNSQNILPGESVNLFAEVETQSPNISYAWAPQTSLQAHTTANPVASPLQNTTYYVTVSIDNTQCTAIDSVEISLFQPVVNAGNDLNVQYGGNVSFHQVSFDEFMIKEAPYDHAMFSRCKFFTGQTGYMTNNNGKVLLKSYDMGNGWMPVLDYDKTVYEMSFLSETHGALGDVEGNVYMTNDGGATWNTSQPYNDQITAMFYTSLNTLYVGSDNGYMEKTNDNGQNWTSINTGTTDHISSLFFIDALNGWAAFSNMGTAYLKKTTNGGQTWTPVNGTFDYVEDMFFHNANEGIVVGYNAVKRTTDGGQTWNHIVVDNGMLTETGMRQIEFLNTNVGYIGMPFIKTTDGGATWKRVQTQYPPVYGISAIHEDTIFGVGQWNYVRYVAPEFNWTPAAYLDNPHAKKPVFTPGVTTTYTLEVNTLYNGVATDQITVNVPDPCLASINYSVDQITHVVTFSTPVSQPPYMNFIYSYLWLFSDGTQSTLPSLTKSFPSAGYHTATLYVTSLHGCVADSTVTIEIGNAPLIDCEAAFNFTMDNNNTVTFTNASLGNNLSHYIWYFDDGQYSLLENPVHTYAQNGIYNVCLTVFSQTTECYNTRCTQVFVDTTGIHCMANFQYTVDTATKTVNFNNLSFHNPQTYAWNFGDGQTSSLEEPVHTYQNNGYYFTHLRITDNACLADYAALINIGMPGGSLQAYFGYVFDQLFNKPTGYPIKFYAATAGLPSKYFWDFGDGNSDSLTNTPTHVYDSAGTYNVCLTVINTLASDTFNVCRSLNIISTSVHEAVKQVETIIYPNPANNNITLNYWGDLTESPSLVICNYLGQEIMQTHIQSSTSNFDISRFSDGVYFVKISTNKSQSIQRLIIQK